MKLTRVGLLSLASVCGAFVCGVVANAAIDLVVPARTRAAPAVVAAPVVPVAPEPQATAYSLASTTALPVDFAPVKVKTIPMIIREENAAQPIVVQRSAAVPLPRPRPASAPDSTGALARQPGSLAIAAAARAPSDEGDTLGPAGIERMKMALALTAEQEEYWPAIAAELRAIGKTLKAHKGHDGKISVDDDTMQRLYLAAAPLITRLSYEQKQKVKQMAHVMGLHQVAAAL